MLLRVGFTAFVLLAITVGCGPMPNLPQNQEPLTEEPLAEETPNDAIEPVQIEGDFAENAPQVYYSMVMKIDGIEGDSVFQDHRSWIDLLTVTEGVSRNVIIGPSTEVSNPTFSEITITKELDSASVPLRERANDFTSKPVSIRFFTHSDTPRLLMEINLTNALVSSVQLSSTSPVGTGSGSAIEHVTIAFEQIKWTYYQYDSNGKQKSKTTAGWNVTTGLPL